MPSVASGRRASVEEAKRRTVARSAVVVMGGSSATTGLESRTTSMSVDETSSTCEVLIALHRGTGTTLGAQVEGQLRDGIRTGQLRPGAQLPSTRDLAGQLGVSRRIVVD